MNRGAPAALALRVVLVLAVAPGSGLAQITLSGTAGAALVEHQVNIGYGVEESTGLVVSAAGAVSVSRVELMIRAAGGSLATTAAGAEKRDVGELGIQASVVPAAWLAIHGAASSRTYATAIARQRWTTVEVGAEAHLDFATSPVRGVLRGGLFPVVSVTGLPRPEVALTAAAGVEYRSGAVTSGLFYGLERYDFPPAGATRRLEQLNTLTVRVTVQRGAPRSERF